MQSSPPSTSSPRASVTPVSHTAYFPHAPIYDHRYVLHITLLFHVDSYDYLKR